MPGIQHLDGGVRIVATVRRRTERNKKGVMPSPNRKERRFVLPEIRLKLRIRLHVRGAVKKEIQLDFRNAGPSEQCRVLGIRFRRDPLRIGDAIRVLEVRTLKGQNVSLDHLAVLGAWRRPITPNGSPRITEPFLISVSILRHDGGHPFGVGHGQPIADRRAVVENVERAVLHPSAFTNASTVRASASNEYLSSRSSGTRVNPKPGRSGAIARYRVAKRGINSRNICDDEGKTCNSKTTGPTAGPASL
jgi:hypothetical protein